MARENIRATILGFAAAIVVFAVLFYFAGVDELIDRVTMADPMYLVVIFGITLLWLLSWGTSLKTVLGVLGVRISVTRAFLVFTGAMFSNNITPFGQAGGEPVTALLISRSTNTEYETGLAAIASVDTLNFVPSITIALIGAGYYATEVTLGRNLEIALVAVVGLAIGVPATVYVAWQRRYDLERRIIRALTPVIRTIARYVPRVPVPSADGIKRRINGFFRSIERVGRNPRGLVVALLLSGFGWFCQMVALWLAFHAIGVPIAFSIALFVVPIGAIAGVTPLPGGAGGIEWALAILVAAASSAVSFEAATAGVVVFRGFIYWVPTLLGGLVMGVESAQGRRA
ncbi:hypothetical protein C440_12384 [Haloferax mucosum ATCC BAA-1512]|uniref:Uncharacterized protein n=1 Tax=Haloferax mucosum ATCC BAA-1512 TaxID=662479 RepID=M0I7Z6_9EURY|nr:lysylphosphatidylglycerol synthase transmembrane domain-containing protein [Haloferax mucosum]ELZ92916.1 hypothetical protein C440_12384 [Haloferax mucosum ATCC BAA-1512]